MILKFSSVLVVIMEGCSIGEDFEDRKCHKYSYVAECKLKNIEEFDDESIELLELRTGLKICLLYVSIINMYT